MNIKHLSLQPQATLDDARRSLESSRTGIVLVLGAQGELLRTVTDGDLRRATLLGLSGGASLEELPRVGAPYTLGVTATPAQIQAELDAKAVDHMPIVNERGQVVDIVHRRDLGARVWLSSPHLGDEETAFVAEAFKTNWIAPLGPHVDAFERELAEIGGVAHGAALSSGTAALHLGLLLLGVKPGDTVLCSSLTFVGSCNPISQCGAQAVFVDSEPHTWNMSPQALERAFAWCETRGKTPRCVIIVNLYGQSADMDALLPICARYGVPVLEDAAESLGALYKGKPSGSFGQLSVFSFNGNKIITTSGGGMLLGNDAAQIARARKLSTQAREPARHYEHVEPGFNYRMSNVLAGIGRGQLKVLKDRVSQRRAVFARYQAAFADLDFLRWMPEPEGYFSTRWLTCFTLELPNARQAVEAVLVYLERHNIEARPVWKPMHLQPLYRDARYFAHADEASQQYPDGDVSAQLFHSGICLPSGSNLSEAHQDRVIDLLRRILLSVAEHAEQKA
jgi:dTDP-4-amino-4,6-dideoxygalactose transaminase